jgi:peptidoglycan/xylan/chitin deacetylase (PgdA/CDA1 family)
LQRILDEGHAIGNHSLDHNYMRYFSGARGVRRWLDVSEAEFSKYGVRDRLVGFRPPAGILTPPLIRVLREKHEPLILWNERFYDAVFTWTEARASRSARKLKPGSIVLLHDRQTPERVAGFCATLESYIAKLKERGLKLRALSKTELAKSQLL